MRQWGTISTAQRGGDLITSPIARAIVWEREDGVDVVIVDAFEGTTLSVESSNSPR